jgi:YD repeat-containing protein
MVAAIILVLCADAFGAAGIERYTYDALGRLRKVEFPDGKVVEYVYDAAGNRRTSGAAAGPPGTIAFVAARYPNGCASCAGEFWIDIRNSGAGALTNVALSLLRAGQAGCTSTSGVIANVAPGQTVRMTWFKASTSSVACGPTVTARGATNSPISWGSL